MAVNQQLKEYVDQQVKVGVSKDVIKSALLEAGWQESDINQAMAGFEPSSAGAGAARPVETAKPVEIKPVGAKPIEPKPSDVASLLSKLSTGSGTQEKSSPVSFVTSDIFQAKNEPVFESKGVAPQTSFPGNKPQISSAAEGMGAESSDNFFKKPIVPIILGALSLLFAAAAGIFYVQNSGLQTELNSVNQENVSLNAKLSSFASDRNILTDQIASLNQTVNDLSNQLSVFAVPSGTSTAEAPVDIKGALSGGGKSLYSVTTAKAIVVYVKNSKDIRVDGTLKPLVGNQVEISGTHMAGSNFVTVTSINGKPPVLIQPASTSTAKASSSVP